jgi:hypothetical protein
MSGSMSGMWARSDVEPLRHRQTKRAETDMFNLKKPHHTLDSTGSLPSATASTGMSRNMLRYEAIARGDVWGYLRAPKHSDLLRMRMRRRPETAEGSRNKRIDV